MKIQYKPIGVIHSPFQQPAGVPIQPTAAAGVTGSVEVYPEYIEGLKDLDGFSHIYLIYHLHLSNSYSLQVIPFLDEAKRGVFSTRAPHRPNPIGLSIVKILEVNENIIHIEGVDILEGTPLLDIKPYLPTLNPKSGVRIGWAEQKNSGFQWKQSDSRFSN